jgi:hypothetical protein
MEEEEITQYIVLHWPFATKAPLSTSERVPQHVWFHTTHSYCDLIFPASWAIPAKLLLTWCHANCKPMNKCHLKIPPEHYHTSTNTTKILPFKVTEEFSHSIRKIPFFLQHKTVEYLRKIERNLSQRGNSELTSHTSIQSTAACHVMPTFFLIPRCAWLAARKW